MPQRPSRSIHRSRRTVVRTLSFVAVACLAVSACGEDEGSGRLTLTSDPANDTGEPDVSIPAKVPTELVITDLTPGTGAGAATGDTVVVHYVGVLSKNGTRFDGNYGGDPIAVTLGLGNVIAGWDQGLIGAKVGGRRQLDIPADLAYGETGAGDSIGPNEALSFVIDVLSVIPKIDATLAPTGDVEARDPVEAVGTSDVVVGTGQVAAKDDTVVIQLVAFRADTGARLQSTWESPQPLTLTLSSGATLEGFLEGISEMKVGGRREITVPYELAFGDKGNSDLGLPEKTDLVVIVDLFAVF